MTPITVMPQHFTAFSVLLLQLELNKKNIKVSFSRSLTALNFLLHLPLPRLVFLESFGGSIVGPMTSVTLLWRLAGVRRLQNAAELTGTLRTFSAALKQERLGDLLSGPLNKEHLFLSSWPPPFPRKAFRRGGLGAPSL